VGFHGTTLTDPGVRKIIEQAEAGLIGGVIIYRYNIINRVQLTQLLQGIQEATTEFPLFVFVDQEGGKIQRVDSSQGFKETLSAKRVAADLSPKAAQQHYADLGQELQAAGFNFDLAPCVDLDADPSGPAIGQLDRSYGQDVTTVTTYAQTMLEGLGSQGVLGCLKHFPGHGRARGYVTQS
jgi:beta-N-acetylhexosaminidase